MSQKASELSIFGDQTNKSRCKQPPGGASSFIFGEGAADSTKLKTNHQASDIFNADENFEHHGSTHGKKCNITSQQEDTQSNLFGTDMSNGGKSSRKGFNPITGELYLEDENCEKKAGNEKTATPLVVKPASVSTRQPPGGKSSKLW